MKIDDLKLDERLEFLTALARPTLRSEYPSEASAALERKLLAAVQEIQEMIDEYNSLERE